MFRRLLIAGLLVAAASLTLRADWQAEYRNGIQAYDKKQWSQVAAFMQKAIDEKPVESSQRVLIYGTRLERYMPHFYRGIALARLARCAEARAEFETSEKQSVIQKESEYVDLKKTRDACVPPLLTASNPTTTTNPPPRAETTQTTTTIVADNRTPVPVPQPPVPVPVPAPTTDTAAEAAKAALATFKRDLQTRVAGARNLLASNPSNGGTTRVRDARRKLSENIDRASRVTTIDQNVSSALSASFQEYQLALLSKPAPPSDLLKAITAYSKGNYDGAVTLLNKLPDDPLYRAHAVLIRAAARYSKSLVSGDKQLLDDVRKDVAAFKGMNPKPPLDKRLFTPRFQSFFINGREPQT